MKLAVNLTDDVRRAWFVSTGTKLGGTEIIDVDPAGLSEAARATLYDALRVSTYHRDADHTLADAGQWRAGIYPQSTEDWASVLASYKIAADRQAAEQAAQKAAEEAERPAREAATKAREEAAAAERLERTLAREAAWIQSGKDAEWAYDRGGKEYPTIGYSHSTSYPYGCPMISPEAIAEAYRRREATEKKREQEEAEAQAIAEKERAEKQARNNERAAWSAANGSLHLKKALAAEYDCWRLYVTERAAAEYPDYKPDFAAKPRYKAMSCPSEQALDEAARVGGRVVWIVSDSPGEGVCITNYLGKYTLLRQLSRRRSLEAEAEQTKAA